MSFRSVVQNSRLSANDNLTVAPSLEELIARKKRHERKNLKVLSSGWKSNTLNFLCLVAAFLLCFAHFEHLQTDADYKLFELRNLSIKFHSDYLSGIVHYGHMISAIMFLLHVAAIKLSKTRFTFLGLLAVLSWPALFFVHYEQINQRDYLISRLALSAFTLLISTAILFLPKKPKRKKRPNTFCSAFSVASTPLSQRSRFTQSQCSWNTNLTHERTKNRTEDFEDDVHSLSSKRYMKIGASEQHNGIRSRGKLWKDLTPLHLAHFLPILPLDPRNPLDGLIDDLLIYSTDDSTENESETSSNEHSFQNTGKNDAKRTCHFAGKKAPAWSTGTLHFSHLQPGRS
uniref:Transmembrane protein n=1 Tax=Globodera pallida TaxID=36090 RepID=A0A183C6I9_GLOPA